MFSSNSRNISTPECYEIPCRFPEETDGTAANLKRNWLAVRDAIRLRLDEFKQRGTAGTEENIFAELVFCLFTPQSKATRCWAAVQRLREKNLLMKGTAGRIAAEINDVRFRYTKAERVVLARKQFMDNRALCLKRRLQEFTDERDAREYLVEQVQGFGYKEASHFLRNIGRGDRIAILDRHILKNLQSLGVISEIPDTLSKRAYAGIERKMSVFSKQTEIPLSHLDLLFWSRQTGNIFK
jgi:N-glycosylase/DNA lyase